MSLQNEVSSTIHPGDDFYQYVNKKWIDSHPIPDDKSRMAAFTILDDETTEKLKTLLESPQTANELRSVSLAKTLYRSAMDESAIETAGTTSLQPTLQSIASCDDADSVWALITSLHGEGRSMAWHLHIDVDDKDSQRYVPRITQSGLGLPDRDYYFETDERFEQTREAYLKFLGDTFALLGYDDVAARAKRVFDFESKLAKVSDTGIEQRDVNAKYNLYTLSDLASSFPTIDWTNYLAKTQLESATEIVISQPKFVSEVLSLVDSEPIDTWRDYLTARYVIPLMNQLSRSYEQLHFSFYGTVLNGVKQQEPRYKRMIHSVASKLPDPAGQLYVESYFNADAKQTIIDLVDRILVATRSRIEQLDWMSDTTKQRAYKKLDTFMPLLGYPDTWQDYTDLILGDDYAANARAIRKFEWLVDVNRTKKPVDRKLWLMSPATVNAYYWPNTNGITFPAAILQPPFFDAGGDFATNYGGIGAVIGHEIIHGFDDQGAEYDEIGNMKPWWTDQDHAAFDARAKQLEIQYDAYEVNGQHVKGALTLGENIADLGGMLVAYDALQSHITETDNHDLIDDFTPEQRFFMSQARIWRGAIRPEMALRFLVTDPHAPAHLRVNGVVTNIDAFYDAFSMTPDNALFKPADQRVRIW